LARVLSLAAMADRIMGWPPKREVPCGLYGQRGVNATGLRQGPPARAEAILVQIRAAGFAQAAVVGRFETGTAGIRVEA
jgi:hypothetical protein